MLIAIFAAILLAFGISSDVQNERDIDRAIAAVTEVVPDRARRSQALEVLERMDEVVGEMARPPRRLVRDLESVLDRHRSTADTIERTLEPLMTHQATLEERLVALRMLLRTYLTAEEWARVFPAPDDA